MVVTAAEVLAAFQHECADMENLLAATWPNSLREKRLHREAIRLQREKLCISFSTVQPHVEEEGVEDHDNIYDKLEVRISAVLHPALEQSDLMTDLRVKYQCLDLFALYVTFDLVKSNLNLIKFFDI